MTTGQRRYLADLEVGQVAESRPHRVDRDEMLAFSRAFDPQYFHTDPAAAKHSVFGDVIASGIYVAAIWRRLDHEINGDIAWICGIAWREVVWAHPMRADDVVRARSKCSSVRPSASDPTRGVVEMRYSLVNHRDQELFACDSVNLIEVARR